MSRLALASTQLQRRPAWHLADTQTHNSRAGWWEPIAVNSGAMWVDKQSDRNATSRDPARGWCGPSSACFRYGRSWLSCDRLPAASVARLLPSPHQASASLLQSNKHLPPGLGFSFHVARVCCEPPLQNFGVPRLRIVCQDGGGWCSSPVLVRRGPSSALSSCPSLRSLPASRLADFGVVVKARTVDPLCLRCCAL